MINDMSMSMLTLPSASPPVEEPEEGGSGGGWLLPDWDSLLNPIRRIFTEAGEKLDRVTTTVSDVMSGQFLKNAIDNLFVLWADEATRPLYDVFSKVYLFTPRLAEIDFVRGLWSLMTILCLVLLIVGIGVLAIQVIKGKKNMKSLLINFIVAFVSSMLSLTVLNLIQVLVNWITNTMVQGILKSETDYSKLGGEEILKAVAIGTDALTDPEYAQFTLMELLKDQGGVINLFIYGFNVIAPMWFIAVIKLLVLIIMVIFVGGWITHSVFTGKIETLIGYLNIYVRTLIVGGVITLHWSLSVKAQTDYMNGEGLFAITGIAPILATPISMVVFYILFFFLWLRPVWRAIRDPIVLNGGEVVENAGKWSEKASLTMQAVGKRLGSEAMQRRGLNVGAAAKKMQQSGKRMQEVTRQSVLSKRLLSKATGGVSEAVAGVKYELPEQWSEEAGTTLKVVERKIGFQGTQLTSEPHEIAHKLGSVGFSAAQIVHISEAERRDMQKMLDTGLQQRYGDDLMFKKDTGQLVVKGKAQAALKELREAHFSTDQVQSGHYKEGIFVQQDGQVSMLEQHSKAKAALKEVKDKLDSYTKVKLTKEEAQQAYTRLKSNYNHAPWSKKLQLRGDELWIPEAAREELTPILQSMRKTEVKKVRVNMPQGSAFLSDLVKHIKEQDRELSRELEANIKENYLYVNQQQLEGFYRMYEGYRNTHIPYYRTSNHKIKVIKDGVPVDYGAVPMNGMDMGSFEKLQKASLRQHTDQQDLSTGER